MKRYLRAIVVSLILMGTVMAYDMNVLAASGCDHHYFFVFKVEFT